MKSPGFAVAAHFPAFRKASLGDILIVDGDQAFIQQVVYGKHIPFQRLKGADGQGFGALDPDDQAVVDVGRQGRAMAAEDQYRRQQAAQASEKNI